MKCLRPTGPVLFFTLIIVLFGSCTDKQKKAPVLPTDCALVMRVDTWEVARKSAIYELKDAPLYKEIINGLKKTNREGLIPHIDNPLKTGLDVVEPVYCFVSRDDKNQSSLIGARAKISGKQKFAEFINTTLKTNPLPVPVLKFGDIDYFMTNQWIVAWSGAEVLFLYQEKTEQTALLEKAAGLLSNTNNGSNLDPDFVNFHSQASDIAVWFNYSQFSDEISQLQKLIIDIDVPKEQFLHIYVDFETGGVNTKIRWYSPAIKDNMLKHFRRMMEENPQYLFKAIS